MMSDASPPRKLPGSYGQFEKGLERLFRLGSEMEPKFLVFSRAGSDADRQISRLAQTLNRAKADVRFERILRGPLPR
jgi:hypothetical protein